MKKIIAILLMFTIFIIDVDAEVKNKLYFTEDGKELVYDSGLLNKKMFMSHIDLIPNQVNTDLLMIENGSSNSCELFFRVVDVKQSDKANNLLNFINMKIYIDEELIYDGTVKGNDIKGNGVDLKNTISLGTFEPGDVSELKAVTQLSKDYTDPYTEITSNTDWQFYAQCVGEEVLPINPNTGDFAGSLLIIICIIFAIISLTIFLYSNKKLKSK